MRNDDNNKIFEIAAVTILSFTAGLAVGMLFAPKSGRENRDWINDQVSGLGDWVSETGQKSVFRARTELNDLRSKVKRGIEKTVPNLYSATDGIQLEEKDLIEK
jgi:gas vesicle protein